MLTKHPEGRSSQCFLVKVQTPETAGTIGRIRGTYGLPVPYRDSWGDETEPLAGEQRTGAGERSALCGCPHGNGCRTRRGTGMQLLAKVAATVAKPAAQVSD